MELLDKEDEGQTEEESEDESSAYEEDSGLYFSFLIVKYTSPIG